MSVSEPVSNTAIHSFAAHIKEKTRGFVGRQWVFGAIDSTVGRLGHPNPNGGCIQLDATHCSDVGDEPWPARDRPHALRRAARTARLVGAFPFGSAEARTYLDDVALAPET